MTYQLSTRDLSKSFGSLKVLRDINLDIERGAFVALVGPSGCGKSTLLRLIAGLEDITGGDLFVAGERVNGVAPQKRNVAMVFQSYALFPNMTVEGNMAFGPAVRGETEGAYTPRLKKAAGILGLDKVLRKRPGQLSGGQRQRVATGRAILRDPELFLFDEPLSNLDAKLRVQMRAEIKSLHQRMQSTVVYVTHDQTEAMTMADVMVVMRDGDIEQMGSPLSIYDRPGNIFVAGFIGSPAMSFLPARHAGGGTAELEGGERLDLGRADLPEAVVLGIRPEHFVPADAGPLPLTATLTECTGNETLIHATLGDLDLRVLLRARTDLKPGDVFRVAVAPEDIHVFDPASEQRL